MEYREEVRDMNLLGEEDGGDWSGGRSSSRLGVRWRRLLRHVLRLSSCLGVCWLQTRTLRVRASSPSENVAMDHRGGVSPFHPKTWTLRNVMPLRVRVLGEGGWPLEPLRRSPAAGEFTS